MFAISLCSQKFDISKERSKNFIVQLILANKNFAHMGVFLKIYFDSRESKAKSVSNSYIFH